MFNNRKQRAILPQDTLAREIAERSVPETLDLLGEKARGMPRAEQRGYIRAYALPVIFEEVLQLVGHEWPPKARHELALAALEMAVHLVVEELRLPPAVAVPIPHIRLFQAA
ncbi:MAG: hypothetical protein IT425_13640 [Pirellulales bacterium]|nr:hypothetical protein [Pirellulales bacterium]